MGGYDGIGSYRCRYVCKDVTWHYRLPAVGNPTRMGRFEEDIIGARDDDLDVGESNDEETTEQSAEEMAMGQSHATYLVALRRERAVEMLRGVGRFQ